MNNRELATYCGFFNVEINNTGESLQSKAEMELNRQELFKDI